MEVGTWLHAVTDVIVVALLAGGVPLAYLLGMARGRAQVDPNERALRAMRKEQSFTTAVTGACGLVKIPDRPCMRAAGHDGRHVWSQGENRIAWEDGLRTVPKYLREDT